MFAVRSLALFSLLFASTAFAAEEKIRVQFDAPATNYKVEIKKVVHVGDELWVISQVSTVGDIGGDAITSVSDEIMLEIPAGATVVHKVLGKGWNWGDDTETLHYVKNAADLRKTITEKGGKIIWEKKPAVKKPR